MSTKLSSKILNRIGLVGVAGMLALLPAMSNFLQAGAIDGGTYELSLRDGAKLHFESSEPMVVNDASGDFHDPETCPTIPNCTMITVKAKATQSTPEVYFLRTTLDWAGQPVGPEVLGVQGSSNDLDLYVFDRRQAIDEETGEPAVDDDGKPVMEYYEITRAATAGIPEQARVLGVGSTEFYFVISNFSGVNDKFTLDIEYEGGDFAGAFEDLGLRETSESVEPPPASASATPGGSPPPPVASGNPSSVAAPPPLDAPSGPLSPVDIETDFADVASAPLDDLLAAGPTAGASSLFATREAGVIKHVSTATALAWLGSLAVATVGLGGGLFMRYRPKALRVDIPTPTG